MAAEQDPGNAAPDPGARSPGNQGARGSRGQANDGALPDNGGHDGRGKPAPDPGASDLGDADAQGGGGAGNESSRSR